MNTKKILSEIQMFTCSARLWLSNIKCSPENLSNALTPVGFVKAINSNFHHKAQENYLEFKKEPKGKVLRSRKYKGDGSCFNSAVETTIFLDDSEKYYAIKTFPTTGETQVTGIIEEDLSDGKRAAQIWADFLTKQKVGVDIKKPIRVTDMRTLMMNFKFRVIRSSPRIILDLKVMEKYLVAAKIKQEIEQNPKNVNGIEMHYSEYKPEAWKLYKEGICIGLPFELREIKGTQDEKNITFRFAHTLASDENKKIRVVVYRGGKINVLGASDLTNPRKIYNFLNDFITKYREIFIVYKPLNDYEKIREKVFRELLSKVTRKN